jgi:hypothetical protein
VRQRLFRDLALAVARHIQEHLLHVLPAVAGDEFGRRARSTILPCFIMSTSSQSRSISGMLWEANRIVARVLGR